MKKFLLIFSLFLGLFAFSQPYGTFTTPVSGNVDSLTVKYAYLTLSGGGDLVIGTNVIKLAGTGNGATLAGTVTLEYSIDGTIGYKPCPVYKLVTYAGKTDVCETLDTFTIGSGSSTQSFEWRVAVDNSGNHPGYSYRLVYTVTANKITVSRSAYLRRTRG